jgi:hypothetical protein
MSSNSAWDEVKRFLAKEGLTIYQKERPEPPRVPYPEPITVSDPLSLTKSRIRTLLQILRKKIEISHAILLAFHKTRNPQARELLYANYMKELFEMDEVWLALKYEVARLKLK